MHTLIRAAIPAILLIITACDVPNDAPESTPVLVGDHLQQLAALTPDELSARRPADDGAADETVDDLMLLTPSEQAYCQPYDFEECRNTCGIFGQYCFVCVIADDGFPVFYCGGGTNKKW